MKKRLVALLAGAVVVLSGCSDLPAVENAQSTVSEVNSDASAEESEEKSEDNKEGKQENTVSDEEAESQDGEEAAAGNEDGNTDDITAEGRIKECKSFTFEQTLEYIDTYKSPYVDYIKKSYETGDRDGVADTDIIKDVDERLLNLEGSRLRILRADKNGAVIDATAYMNPETRFIEKIETCEYGSEGRIMDFYYFYDGDLKAAYEYKTDYYGTTYDSGMLPGKKGFFDGDGLIELYVNDEDVSFVNRAYLAKDYDKLSPEDMNSYDTLEETFINNAYSVYEVMRSTPRTALLYGYVGEEQVASLENVHITVHNKANNFSKEILSNADGYFEIRVPAVNDKDWYGIACKYGSWRDSTVDDIKITQMTLESSLGIVFMAESNDMAQHEANSYLLNVLEKPPVSVGEDEYLVSLSYGKGLAALKPFLYDAENGRMNSDSVYKFKKKDGLKYFVIDDKGMREGNNTSYDMTFSEAHVKVYDSNGLCNAFDVPGGKAGIVWEVFEVKNGQIVPLNNYFHSGKAEPFYKN